MKIIEKIFKKRKGRRVTYKVRKYNGGKVLEMNRYRLGYSYEV